ncbi:hypothetical protein GCM10017776_35090 [Streptomyces griseoluteus]|nr:hypothetical protein GCM10017776_35090 [Streptomyces griseoluteus]
MSEGYEAGGGAAGAGFTRSAETTPDHAGIPFLGHVIRVSGLRRHLLRARRAAPDGRIRHA